MQEHKNEDYALIMTILFSIAFGFAMHDWTLGICMGICFGVAFGLFGSKEDDENE